MNVTKVLHVDKASCPASVAATSSSRDTATKAAPVQAEPAVAAWPRACTTDMSAQEQEKNSRQDHHWDLALAVYGSELAANAAGVIVPS